MLSRLSGVSVRKLRFYSDAGLIPPSDRTESGYRVFTETDLARLDLISSLREAGVGLDQIREIVSRRRSLTDVLVLRAEALELEIASRRRMAALLRATLNHRGTEDDLTELWAAMKLSRQQYEQATRCFYLRVISGAPSATEWASRVMEAAVVELPDDPTPEQVAAWREIVSMISEPNASADLLKDLEFVWNDNLDAEAYWVTAQELFAKVQCAVSNGIDPTGSEGFAIAEEWIARSASAMSRQPDELFIQWHLDQYAKHGDRRARFEQLKQTLAAEESRQPPGAAWAWMNQALTELLRNRTGWQITT